MTIQKISASVGKGGKNNTKDVTVIQKLMLWHKQWIHPHVIKNSGKYDKNLEETIILFQKKACSLIKPDGRIDPNGFTLSSVKYHAHFQTKTPYI